MRAGESWLWLLRRCSTNLFRLQVCADPVWIEYPMDEDAKSLVWLARVTADGGRGQPLSITKDEARKLAHAGYDADADAVLLATATAHQARNSPVYLDTPERLVDRGVDVRRGITAARNKGLLGWDDECGLVPAGGISADRLRVPREGRRRPK
jgi:hypothetical protein